MSKKQSPLAVLVARRAAPEAAKVIDAALVAPEAPVVAQPTPEPTVTLTMPMNAARDLRTLLNRVPTTGITEAQALLALAGMVEGGIAAAK